MRFGSNLPTTSAALSRAEASACRRRLSWWPGVSLLLAAWMLGAFPARSAEPAPAANVGGSGGEVVKPRTLQRTLDVVVTRGQALTGLLSTPLNQLGCFKGPNPLVVIPCQIDEKTNNGQYILTSGPEARPQDSDGRLSPQDELLFVAQDAGPQVSSPQFPAGAQRFAEVEVVDPQDGALAWVYVAAFAGKAPRSNADYVTFRPSTGQVEGQVYRLTFSKEAPIVFDDLTLLAAGNGNGTNPVDRMKIRLDAKVWGTIPILKTEDDYSSELMGYIDGPVRVLRRTRNRLIIWWKIPSPSAVQDNFFYGRYFEFPIQVSLPLDLDSFLSEATLRISVDLKGKPEREFINARNRTPVKMDGVPTADEKALDRRPAQWSALYGTRVGNTGGWFNRLTVGANTRIDPWLYYGDDSSHADAPEATVGEVGDIGYEVRNLKGLTKGTHTLTSVLYHFPSWTPELERRYLAIQDAPLQTRVRRAEAIP